ncbi:MAG: hypothetical protein AAB262_07670 [Elusimicrobiota bacterium]
MSDKIKAGELVHDGSLEFYGEVKTDSKNRVVLKGPVSRHYQVYRNESGQIILDPQIMIPASQAWLFGNKKALASVRRGLEESAGGKARKWRSFAAHAGDKLE